jgi:hypothetical protein
MAEYKTLADYMKEYYVKPEDGNITLADGQVKYFGSLVDPFVNELEDAS